MASRRSVDPIHQFPEFRPTVLLCNSHDVLLIAVLGGDLEGKSVGSTVTGCGIVRLPI